MPRKSQAAKDKEIVDEVVKRTEDLQKRHEDLHKRWLNDLKYYHGIPKSLLKDQEISVLDPENRQPVFNYVLPDVEIHTANMISAQPEIFVHALAPDWDADAERLTDAIHAEWAHRAARAAFRRVCRTAIQTGTGLLDVRFRQLHGAGRGGALSFEWLNPFEVLIDPHAITFDDARFIAICRYVTRQEAARLYPLMKSDIADMAAATVRDDDATETIRAMTGSPYFRQVAWAAGDDKDSEVLRYIELWQDKGRSLIKVLGDKLVREQINGPDGPEEVTYPSRTPFSHGMFPFVPIYATDDVYGPWGTSDIYHIRDGQDHFNKLMQQTLFALDCLATVVTKQYVVPDSRGADAMRELTDVMGYRLVTVDGPENVPKMVEARTLVEYVNLLQTMAQVLDKASDDIGGISDTMTGVSQPRVYSGRHSAQLQAAAERRFVPRLDSLTCSMQRIGERAVSVIQQFYTDQLNARGFALVTEKGERRVFRTHDEDGEPVLPRLEDEEGNALEFGEDDVPPGIDQRFEIYVQPQDEMPMSRQAFSQYLVQAMQYGGADAEAVARAARIPAGRAMLARMGEKLLAGVDPIQPWPADAVAQLAEKARADIDLTMMQQALQRIALQMQLQQAAQQLQQTGQMPELGGGPPGGAAPPGTPALGPPPEMGQEAAEMGMGNVGQPPVEEGMPYG